MKEKNLKRLRELQDELEERLSIADAAKLRELKELWYMKGRESAIKLIHATLENLI